MLRSIDQRSALRGFRRILGGSGLLVFLGAFFVLPLFAALALCAMPCCHQETGSAGSVVSAGMAACETECSSLANEASSDVVPSVLPESGADRSAPVATAVALVDAPAVVAMVYSRAVGFTRGAGAPLHILNSTFRI